MKKMQDKYQKFIECGECQADVHLDNQYKKN